MNTLKSAITVISITIFLTACGDNNEKKTNEALVPKEGIVTQEEKSSVKKDTTKQMNILDEQAKLLSKVFGNVDTEEGRAFSKVNNYLDLVEQANFPPDNKKNLLNQYKLYELSLDPQKKDSLKIMFNQKLTEAIAKSASNQK
ncbi:hypothetical protein [Maribacter sp. IgM3_T14_3]|uniref:hypothetical protein n=1 Tax=Maribacter sp. IgM3_T14_3 TaxID=3415140 RepID=UPI003C6F6017